MLKYHILQHPSSGDSNFRCTVCGQEWPITDDAIAQIKQSICVKEISIGSKQTPTLLTVTGQTIKGKS